MRHARLLRRGGCRGGSLLAVWNSGRSATAGPGCCPVGSAAERGAEHREEATYAVETALCSMADAHMLDLLRSCGCVGVAATHPRSTAYPCAMPPPPSSAGEGWRLGRSASVAPRKSFAVAPWACGGLGSCQPPASRARCVRVARPREWAVVVPARDVWRGESRRLADYRGWEAVRRGPARDKGKPPVAVTRGRRICALPPHRSRNKPYASGGSPGARGGDPAAPQQGSKHGPATGSSTNQREGAEHE
jgi:hypothetical protein